ncbi:hypothetical protein R1sor_012779 [Riccia sorocarpa]|uniref:50S ribosomal protein L35, chloroplastic n=1 Tax=Riccia sorocarpa TaxID=122646 RepID=A0ABD3I4R7_9MARC
MALRGLQRFSSHALRALRCKTADNGFNPRFLLGAELVECQNNSSVIRSSRLDYGRHFASVQFRGPSSNLHLQDKKIDPSFFAAPLSTLSSPRLSLLPSSAGSFGEPRFRGDGLLVQQLNASSMQQKRGLSKLKKYKMKAYSSYKERFKLMADGTFKRWRSGTRHNAHSKTAKQRRQLRRPSIAPLALAKVMKKLNFIR